MEGGEGGEGDLYDSRKERLHADGEDVLFIDDVADDADGGDMDSDVDTSPFRSSPPYKHIFLATPIVTCVPALMHMNTHICTNT